jgi:hypothetical protein
VCYYHTFEISLFISIYFFSFCLTFLEILGVIICRVEPNARKGNFVYFSYRYLANEYYKRKDIMERKYVRYEYPKVYLFIYSMLHYL